MEVQELMVSARPSRNPRAHEDEEYGDYQRYWHQEVLWPSLRNGVEQTTAIDEMSPQQAAACFAKLMRWERMYFNSAEDDPLVMFPMAIRLADQALGYQLQNVVDAVMASVEMTPTETAGVELDGIDLHKTLAGLLDTTGEYDSETLVEHSHVMMLELNQRGLVLRKRT